MSAQVTSFDALRNVRLAFKDFELDVRDGVEMLRLEVRRAVDWIEHDRTRYWPDQMRRASDSLIEAKNELERCQMKVGSDEPRPCLEQKHAVEMAKRRLRLTEEKVQRVKHWLRIVRQELNEFEGRIGRLAECADADVPRAIASLERMLKSLEKYAALEVPELPPAAVVSPTVSNPETSGEGT